MEAHRFKGEIPETQHQSSVGFGCQIWALTNKLRSGLKGTATGPHTVLHKLYPLTVKHKSYIHIKFYKRTRSSLCIQKGPSVLQ